MSDKNDMIEEKNTIQNNDEKDHQRGYKIK